MMLKASGLDVAMRQREKLEDLIGDDGFFILKRHEVQLRNAAAEGRSIYRKESCTIENVGKFLAQALGRIVGAVNRNGDTVKMAERTQIIHAVCVVGMIVRDDSSIN